MDFIDRLRQKSAGTKKKIAFATSAVVTLMIFGIWSSVLHFGFDQKSSNATAAVANSSDTDVNPFSAFWSVISTGWGGLTKNINQIKTDAGQAQDFVKTLGATTTTGSVGTTNSQPVPQSKVQSAPQQDVFILSNTPTDDTFIMQ